MLLTRVKHELHPAMTMKTRILQLLMSGGAMAAACVAGDTVEPAIFPEEDGQTPEDYRLVWPATPGLRYEVRQSPDLDLWTTLPGYPVVAPGPAMQVPFVAGGEAGFFQVRELDEQPPAIAARYPADGAFAVPRFARIALELSDATGVDPASLSLAVGGMGPFTLASKQLTYTNGVLTFDGGGDTALGGWGSRVAARLIAGDTLGNLGTNDWSFDLEIQPVVVTNLFVFGSPRAQRAGQRIGNIPTAVLANRFGPVAAGAGDPWTLELVSSNHLVIAYSNTAPVFETNTYVCNLTPVGPDQIFSRKITGVSDDAGRRRLTLDTVDVPLEEMVQEGSTSVSGTSVVLEGNSEGRFTRAYSVGGTITFPRIGFSLDGAEFKLRRNGFESTVGGVGFEVGDKPDLVRMKAEQLHWWLTPRLQCGLEITAAGVQRLDAVAQGNVAAASVLDVDVLLVGAALNELVLFDLPETLEPKVWMLIGVVGVPPFAIPVFGSLGFDLQLTATFEARADLECRLGFAQDFDAAFGVSYVKGQDVRWVKEFKFGAPAVEPFTPQITGEMSLKASLKPALEFLVYGAAGVSAEIRPSSRIVFEAGTARPLTGRLTADVSLVLGLAGPAFEAIRFEPELSLKLWEDELWRWPDEAVLSFSQHPRSQCVPVGGSAYFSCALATPVAARYQWLYNGTELPGQTSRTLSFPIVGYGHAGSYCVRAFVGEHMAESESAWLTVVEDPKGSAGGMARVPAGVFTMGDTIGDGESDARPAHQVEVSAFYMDWTEVTKAQWDDVYGWAIAHDYTFDNPGAGKAPGHPVTTVNWYDAVKWCNARSQKEGRTPAYYTDGAFTEVYRKGPLVPQVRWNAGYRLPTEAEWEKAARGGLSGRRFPWGDTITHSQANYWSNASYSYDISPTRAYHPKFAVGAQPYTSPVAYFAPNGYGICDVAGNVWEWCWDWLGGYTSAPQGDPRGPASGSQRVIRGGWWGARANGAQVSDRFGTSPVYGGMDGGFRCVLPVREP